MWDDMPVANPSASSANWLLTFTDLIGLLLCFFVLIFSTKTLDVAAWDVFRGSMRGTFARAEAVVFERPDQLNNADEIAKASRSVLPYLEKVFAKRVANDPVWSSVKGGYDKKTDQLAYVLPAGLWQDGKLSETGAEAVDRISVQLRNWRNMMVLQARVSDDADMADVVTKLETMRQRLLAQGVTELRRSEVVGNGGKDVEFKLIVHGEKSLCLGC